MEHKVKLLSRVRLFAAPWTVAYQAPRSLGFSRQEHWSGLPFPSPGHLPNPGIEPGSPTFQADALTSEPPYPQLYFLKENWFTESLMNPFTEKVFEYLLHGNLCIFLVEVKLQCCVSSWCTAK